MSVAGATVLVVDDEPAVLDTVRDGLAAHGYQVLTAAGPDEAIQVAQAHAGTIALALIDVVMPGMSGPEVARRLHESRPDLKVLFMSGFSTEVVVVHGLTEGDPLLVKPFSLATLARKVHDVLDYRSPFSRPP
jgi:two-component system, cell cycle sensor histidine kinase and response regulator CckA